MLDQLLVNVISTGILDPGDSVVFPHGLKVAGQGVVPTQVVANGPTTIGVESVTDTNVTFKNFGPDAVTATFRVEFDHSVHATGAQTVVWTGWSGTARPAGPAGGDLDETYPDPRVVGFAGQPIDTDAPVAGDYWKFDGAEWKHTLAAPGDATAIYGSFSRNTDQDLTAGVANIVSFDTNEGSNGVSVVAGTKLTVAESGVYALAVSPQLQHGGGGAELITFWLRLNGSNVPRSASSLEMGNNNNRTLPFIEIILPMNAGQWIEWAFNSSTGTDIKLKYFPPNGVAPAIPSVIASVKRIGSLP